MVFDIIKKRRSVFPVQYNDRPIAVADIEKILQAANWAPNHKNTEPWRFKVMTGESKEKLGLFLSYMYMEHVPNPKQIKAKKLIDNPKKAGAIIAICMQRDPQERIPEWEEVAATAMAVQNMWLCCTEMGIGCYWSSPPLVKYMDEFFEMQEGEVCLGFFYMGHFDEKLPEANRTPIEDKVTWMDR
ncbi:nitroreductase family protein [Pseudozobellia thermophila]|uniref:Putative NAD(P)H nitroreductase n=1 Tax=Pseudozobellia thermophila TaxID=192903 RepID=A0A1M6MYR7_9FLAO|nr:nitroreductase [Pseudozobellia thermophila]SHJ88631.1 Nitroreductase [Pseudozobellia thermophila]